MRESAILLGCLNHPDLAEKLESQLERLPYLCPDLRQIGNALLNALPETVGQDFNAAVSTKMGYDVADKLLSIRQVASNFHLRPNAEKDLAEQALSADIARQFAIVGIIEEMRDAEAETDPDEGLTWRLKEARNAVHDANQGALKDEDNSEDDREAADKLQSFIDGKIWEK